MAVNGICIVTVARVLDLAPMNCLSKAIVFNVLILFLIYKHNAFLNLIR